MLTLYSKPIEISDLIKNKLNKPTAMSPSYISPILTFVNPVRHLEQNQIQNFGNLKNLFLFFLGGGPGSSSPTPKSHHLRLPNPIRRHQHCPLFTAGLLHASSPQMFSRESLWSLTSSSCCRLSIKGIKGIRFYDRHMLLSTFFIH